MSETKITIEVLRKPEGVYYEFNTGNLSTRDIVRAVGVVVGARIKLMSDCEECGGGVSTSDVLWTTAELLGAVEQGYNDAANALTKDAAE